MGEARRRKENMKAAMSGLGGTETTPHEVAVPTLVLNAFEGSWPSLWSLLEKGSGMTEKLLGVQLQPWCAAPVDLARWTMERLVEDGHRPRQMFTASMPHEAAVAAGLYTWRRRRAIRVVDPALIAAGTTPERSEALSREAFLSLPGQAVYVVTPGMKLHDAECVGVLAYVDDPVREGGREDPELHLVCMLRAETENVTVKALRAKMGCQRVGDICLMPMSLPMPEGDLRAAFLAVAQERRGRAKRELGVDLDNLFQALGALRSRIASNPEAPPEVARALAGLSTDPSDVAMEVANKQFENTAKIAAVVAMACSDEYESRIVAGQDRGLGEVRVVGPGRAADAAAPGKVESAVAANDAVAAENPANPQQTGPAWAFGADIVAVEDMVANAPRLIRPAQLTFLWPQPSGHGVILPRADLVTTDALKNIGALMPGLAVEVAPPGSFEEKCRALGDAAPAQIDSVVRIPRAAGEPWQAIIKSRDEQGQYVAAERLLHALGQYALCRAAGLGPQSLDGTRVACYWETAGLIWSLESARKAIGEPRALSPNMVLQIAGYFAAYPIACFLNLDPRLVSFGLLGEEWRNPEFRGLIEGYMGDLRYIVAFPEAMAAFLKKRAGVTQQQWLDAAPDRRLAMSAQCALELLRYQDLPALAGLTGAEGGIKWLPEKTIEAMSAVPKRAKVPPELMTMMEVVYEETEAFVRQQIGNGPMPTMLTGFRMGGQEMAEDDYFVPELTGGSEAEFISRKLANPDCAFVTRISEAWIGAGEKRKEGIVLRFVGRDFGASGIFLFTRDPLRVEKQPLVVDGSPEDNRLFGHR